MTPREGGRHCAHCDRVVVDLTAATRARAEAIAKRGACARVRVDAEGAPAFRDPPLVPLRLVPLRRAASGLVLAAAVSACEPSAPVAIEAAPIALDLGPPMIPMSERSEPEQDAGVDAAVPTVEEDTRPTAAQRARTRRKHRPPVAPPPQFDMGYMLYSD
ncbi:hypothetical protein [Sandaracinus amylolyticus]|uniref:hypothetical protein n=1 Tax=Sandaracinus amylolyticus TaxID=927083 RepID=UPI001F26772B|nr:hypothetical protein [Sandaracinus amylolyticus]UJR78640.1 Hypothetical protein I5071_6710 [Sandaracinus amylolyticus]